MILSGHQPCYLPGIQFFNKIAWSDAFMFVGHCDYQPKSWHSHNFIRTCELTVPIKRPHNVPINEAEIDGNHWKRKHIKSIEMAYGNFPFFDDYFPTLKAILERDWFFLGTMNQGLIVWILEWLNINTKILSSFNFKIEGAKEDMLISMCKAVGADEYLSNVGARDYLGLKEEVKMYDAGIKSRWQKFVHPVYGQDITMNGGQLSVIDLLMWRGPDAEEIVKNSGGIE